MTNLTREQAADIMQTSMEQMLEAGRILVMFDPNAADSLALTKTAHEMAIAALREKPEEAGKATGGNDLHVAAAMLSLQGKSAYKIGDIIRSKHAEFGLIEWRVIGLEESAGDDGEIIVSMTLHNTVPVIGYHFDWLNPRSPRGYADWFDSDVRRYLYRDFLAGFSELDKLAISDSRKKTYSPSGEEFVTTHDKLFLLSPSEMGYVMADKRMNSEGPAYAYYGLGCGASKHRLVDQHGKPAKYLLRSTDPDNKRSVFYVDTDGHLQSFSADNGGMLAPACVIRASYAGGRQV